MTEKFRKYKKGLQHTQIPHTHATRKEYSHEEAFTYALIIMQIRERGVGATKQATQHAVTYSLKKGFAKFGERGRQAAFGEMKQLHDRKCFIPIHVHTMTQSERRKPLNPLYF
jgi:hypothetical protein